MRARTFFNRRGRTARLLDAIRDALHPARLRAVRAAEDLVLDLHAVPDDPAAAVRAHRRQQVDGALEAVEDVRLAALLDGEGLVVRVAAYLATLHGVPPL